MEIVEKRTLEEYLDTYENISFSANGERLTVKEILTPLRQNDDVYQEFYNSIFKNKKLGGISLESYYKLLTYTFTKTMVGKYEIPFELEKKINEIIISLKAVINYLKAKENIATKSIDKIEISQELKNAVLGEVDEALTPLEKAIYIYLKLCKYLTYDAKFYLSDGYTEQQPHKSLDNLKDINLDKNRIVCYEFNMLYAKFLQSIGLKPVIFGRENYSENHETLEILVSNLILAADSTTSFFKNDLTNAKLGLPLKGLKCQTKNEMAEKEFNVALNKVYEIIKKEENRSLNEFDFFQKEYQVLNSKKFKIPLKERVEIMCNALSSSSLIDMDLMSYALELKDILFTKEELLENVFFTALGMKKDEELFLVAILAFNEYGFKNKEEETKYYLYHQKSFQEITKEEIIALIQNEELENNSNLSMLIGDVYNDREVKRDK